MQNRRYGRLQPLIAALLLAALTASAGAQQIVAHRGASHDAPENTLAAFELAWQRDADAIEVDLFLSSDGEIVCIHDRTTERFSEENLVVAESTAAELKQLDVGSWKDEKWAGEPVPTLDEVIATVPDGRRIYLEIKPGPEVVEPLARAVEASDLVIEQQVVVIAFDADVIAAVRERLPQATACWLTSYRKDDETGELRPTPDQVLSTLERIDATGLSTHANENVVDEAFVRRLREAGFEFHTWTVNGIDTARRFAELGVDSITTDRPGWLREQLETSATATEE